MSGAQKVSISLLISVLVFSVLAVLVAVDRFRVLETAFYIPRVEESIRERAEQTADVSDAFHARNLSRYGEFVLEDAVRAAFRINASAAQIQERRDRFDALEAEQSSLDRIRIIDLDATQLHYSSDPADYVDGATRRTYLRPDEVSEDEGVTLSELAFFEDIAEDFELPTESEIPDVRIFLHPQANQFIYRLPVLDTSGILQGAALFYVNVLDLSTSLIRNGLIGTGDQVRVVNENGIAVRVPVQVAESLVETVDAQWRNIAASDERVSLVSDAEEARRAPDSAERSPEPAGQPNDLRYEAFSVEPSLNGTLVYLEPSTSLEMPLALQYTLVGAVFLTTFLIAFLILNVRQDAVVVLRDRVKRFQVNLLREYMEAKEEIDFERWRAELEDRRDDVSKRVRRGLGRLKSDEKEEVDELIDRTWDEIIDVLSSRAQSQPIHGGDIGRIEEIVDQLTRRLAATPLNVQATQAAPPPAAQNSGSSAQPRRPVEVEDVEELEDADDVEEIGAVEELDGNEELGELEGPDGGEEVEDPRDGEEPEELGELEAAEEPEGLGELEDADEADVVDELDEAEELVDDVGLETPHEAEEVGELESVDEANETEEVAELESQAEELEEGEEPLDVEETGDLDEVLEVEADEEHPADERAEVDELEEDLEPIERETESIASGRKSTRFPVGFEPESVTFETLNEHAELEWLAANETESDELEYPRPVQRATTPELQLVRDGNEASGAGDSPEVAAPREPVLDSDDDVAQLDAIDAEVSELQPIGPDDVDGEETLEPLESVEDHEQPEEVSYEDGATGTEDLEELESEDSDEDPLVPDELPRSRHASTTFGAGLFGFGRGTEVRLPRFVEQAPAAWSHDRGASGQEPPEPDSAPGDASQDESVAELDDLEPVASERSRRAVRSDTGLVRIAHDRTVATADYEIAEVSDVLGRLHISKSILLEEDGVFQIDRSAYQAPVAAKDQDVHSLIRDVTGSQETEGTPGVEELFGGSSEDELSEFASVESPRDDSEERLGVSVFRFTDQGFDYDGFLRGYKRNDSGLLKSMVSFTRYWNARVGIIFQPRETEHEPYAAIGIDDRCRSSMVISRSSSVARNILNQGRVLLIKRPLTEVEYFQDLCSPQSLAFFERSLFLPLVLGGERAYFLLGLRGSVDSLEEAFRAILPVIESRTAAVGSSV